MSSKQHVPHHINAQVEDFKGNGKWGRYVILPGSDGRAAQIAHKWNNVSVKKHPRAHNLYIGTMSSKYGEIDMAAVSTGMGTASADIIINELKNLGVRNFIRIGTAGSLQPHFIKQGSIVVPTGCVKDESTTSKYLPAEVPAVPSFEFLIAAKKAVDAGKSSKHPVFFGIVHTKDSLYAREMLVGPKSPENERYMTLLKKGGVLASEMETSILFTLGSIFNYENINKKELPILTGAVLAVIGGDEPFGDKETGDEVIEESILYTMRIIETIHGARVSG